MKQKNKMTSRGLIKNIRNAYPVTDSVYFKFEEYSIEVLTNNVRLIGDLKRYFNGFITEKTSPDITITVH
jgi:hypothetical protein